jgi:hypothetical protein
MIITLKDINFYFLTFNNPGRKKHMEEIFKDYKLFEINPNIHENRSSSCASGFLKILEKAIEDQDRNSVFKPFVMLEDDCSWYREFPNTLNIPENSDILYIGISNCGSNENYAYVEQVYSKKIDEKISRIYNMLSLHGVIVCSMEGAFILQKCMMEAYFKGIIQDVFTAKIQPFYNVYCLNEPLVYQDMNYNGHESGTKIIHSNNVEIMPSQYLDTTITTLMTSNKKVYEKLQLC